MSRRQTAQIPVIVLAGFLGAGKTTLLNHLLRGSGGTRVGVVVNDFGAIEIDAMSVSGQAGSTVSLGNGCLCCAVDGSELDSYLERLTRPSVGLDVIVIEASGLAEPQELVRMLLASDNPRIVYGGLLEVVDAAEFESARERHPELARHLALADLVVLNKADRVAESDRDRLEKLVSGLSDGAAVVSAAYGAVDPELLFERRPRAERFGQLSFEDVAAPTDADGEEPGAAWPQTHHEHLHTAYASVSYSDRRPLAPRGLLDFLDRRPEGLYRIKGYVDFGAHDPHNRYVLHSVGRFLRFYPEPWPDGAPRGTALVLIGTGIDADALTGQLDACRDGEPQQPREEDLWGVLRFVPDAE